MAAVFLKALNMSMMAGWLILAVAFVRLLLKKAPKWIRLVLWLLVAVRLVFPISIRSAISLIPGNATIPADMTVPQTAAIPSGITTVNEIVDPVPAGTLPESAASNTNLPQQIITAAAYLWIVGITAMMIYAILTWVKLKKSVAASVPIRDGIMACDEVKSPFIFGILHPLIYTPSSMGGETLDYVVRHEQAHLKRYDHWWKPLGYLLLSVYWFNPLCWLSYILFCRDIELACDEKVIRYMSREETASYAKALLDLSMPVRRIAVCPLAFGEVGVKERIRVILNYKKPAFWSVIAAVLVCVIVAGCFMTTKESDGTFQAGKESQAEPADVSLAATGRSRAARSNPYFDRPHVVSSSPMGVDRAYAFGHVSYSDTIAAAYTACESDGYKYVSVYGIYLSDSGIKRTAEASSVSVTRGSACIYVTLPEDGIRFLGVNAVHKVKSGATSWADSAWLGEQQYD